MATYNKRGYKAPKPEEVVDDSSKFEEVVDTESTTAEVFDTLDQKANRAEEWVEKNQKIIMGIVGGLAVLATCYFLYVKFVSEPKEEEAVEKIFQAQKFFKEAIDGAAKPDSLFKLSLKGGEGQLGFEGIISEYSGTKTANLAHYFAGMAYYNLKEYKKSVDYLEEFSGNDENLQPLALGTIGDAFSELKKYDDALKYYNDAANVSDNDFTTPMFLMKHGQLAMLNGKKDLALSSFKTIKEKYPNSSEATNIDAYIARVEE